MKQLQYTELLERMTLEEKASLLSGANFWNTKPVSRLGIPSILLTDGPHGLRKQGGKADHLGLNKSIPATCFPTASALANSWDVELLERIGACLGEEAAAEGVSVLLGPGLNCKRNPLCGRNFEYFSEDPYLSGKLAAAMVRGIQSQGVSACPKHYAVNSQETRRMVIDEVVDERALREIYLEGFRYAVTEGKPGTIMSSYNRVNGAYANENTHLMRDILYGEWDYDGVVVTDWGGENDRVAGLIAGNQLEMPSSAGMTDREVVAAVESGALDQALLDERVDSLLRLVFEVRKEARPADAGMMKEHRKAALEAARRSAVLVKNEGGVLPLANGTRVAVIGDFAKRPRYQGAGSSLIVPTRLKSALDALKQSELEIIGCEAGFRRFGGADARKLRKAAALARRADVALVFLGLDEGSEAEGVDRTHLRLPENQIALLHAIRAACGQVIVILANGAPVETNWSADANAVLLGYLGGQEGGRAIADLVTGKAAPSGKLAETYPVSYADIPTAGIFPGETRAEHRESIFVGYRYFDTAKKNVAWPFGFGLTYTTFSCDELRVEGNEVRFFVRNTGDRAGAEIVQVYISKQGSAVFRAEQELKGFARVWLEPGERKPVVIRLDEHAFAYFHTAVNAWIKEPGEYEIRVGASSRDVRLKTTVDRPGMPASAPYDQNKLPHYFNADVANVSDAEFFALIGGEPVKTDFDPAGALGYGDTIWQGRNRKGLARLLYRLILIVRRLFFLHGRPIAANNVMFAMHLPFRSMARMSGGRVDMAMLDGILVMVNGRF
ncbi:MAG TPA: glycoside hydrolase family 3 C-terminal domain-containing protein, partial [Feifaniaceae bacterium]|nr:glycoside hydrolase family 3 C-terminal domain-containing protein [Feifaniaceae bacterium]